MEALDEKGELIDWINNDWVDWCSTCKSCNALGTNKCEFPEKAAPDTKFHEIGCRYEDKCASCTKLGTAKCTHPDVATKDTFIDNIPCNDDDWESVIQY